MSASFTQGTQGFPDGSPMGTFGSIASRNKVSSDSPTVQKLTTTCPKGWATWFAETDCFELSQLHANIIVWQSIALVVLILFVALRRNTKNAKRDSEKEM